MGDSAPGSPGCVSPASGTPSKRKLPDSSPAAREPRRAPSPPEAAAHAGKAGSITPSPSPAARSQTTLTNFFKLKGASGPRPAVAAPPGLAGSEWMKKADEGAEQRDTAGGHGHIPGSPAPSSEQRDTAGSGGLIPSSFVSFCEDPSRKGGFTPVYESADGSYADFAGMASLNAGAFRLYVGGAAINRGFALMLKGCGHDVGGYGDTHFNFYYDVINRINKAPEDQRTELKRQLYCLSEASEEEPLKGLKESYLLLSSLPNRFVRDRVRAGCVFIDIFEEAHRPCKNKVNQAMIYCVGPEGDQALDDKDFIAAVEYTGNNLLRAVTLYNQRPASAPIDYIRVCLVSGGLFRHEDVSKQRVAQALIAGISAAFVDISGTREEEKSASGEKDAGAGKLLPHVNFAFDEDVFSMAYDRMHWQAKRKRTVSTVFADRRGERQDAEPGVQDAQGALGGEK